MDDALLLDTEQGDDDDEDDDQVTGKAPANHHAKEVTGVDDVEEGGEEDEDDDDLDLEGVDQVPECVSAYFTTHGSHLLCDSQYCTNLPTTSRTGRMVSMRVRCDSSISKTS